MHRGLLIFLMPLFGLAACQFRGEPPSRASPDVLPPPVFTPAPGRCTAARARFGLGQRVSRPLLEEMRLRAGARAAHAVLPTDAPLPHDAARLMVDVESSGRIVAARCG